MRILPYRAENLGRFPTNPNSVHCLDRIWFTELCLLGCVPCTGFHCLGTTGSFGESMSLSETPRARKERLESPIPRVGQDPGCGKVSFLIGGRRERDQANTGASCRGGVACLLNASPPGMVPFPKARPRLSSYFCEETTRLGLLAPKQPRFGPAVAFRQPPAVSAHPQGEGVLRNVARRNLQTTYGTHTG